MSFWVLSCWCLGIDLVVLGGGGGLACLRGAAGVVLVLVCPIRFCGVEMW
jgi:hypothetical protein